MAFKENTGISSTGSDDKIRSEDQSKFNVQDRNGNELSPVLKSAQILKGNARVNTMFVQEDSSELAIEQAQSSQPHKSQPKNSNHRSFDKSERITDDKRTEKTETNPNCGSSLLDQIKQRTPSPNLEDEATEALEPPAQNLKDESQK